MWDAMTQQWSEAVMFAHVWANIFKIGPPWRAFSAICCAQILLLVDAFEFACWTGWWCRRKRCHCLDSMYFEASALYCLVDKFVSPISFFSWWHSAFQTFFLPFAIFHPRSMGMEPSLAASHFLSSVVYIVLMQLGMHCPKTYFWHRWTEIGRVCVFCSEALLSSEVRDEHSCRSVHKLLPAKVLRSFWSISDARLHLLFPVNHRKSVVKFLREAQGNQVMKRIFFLSILKRRLGPIHLQLSLLSRRDDKIENTGTHPCCQLILLCLLHLVFICAYLY